MAIDPISSTQAFQTMGVSQNQTVVKNEVEEPVSKDGEVSKENELRPDAQTVMVEGSQKAAEDGENGGAGAQEDSLQKKEKESDKIKKAVEELNKKMHNSVAKFGIHEKTNRVTIKIMDKDTDELIREYPPEKTLDMIAKVWELQGIMAQGIMVDEKR